MLAGCTSAATPAEKTRAAKFAHGFPVTVTNCGTKVTFDRPPERVVTIKSTTTELMLALGLEDRVVARAFQDGPVPKRWAQKVDDIPVLSEEAPSQEATLETEPDLIFAGWESNLAPETAGERDVLAQLGIASYVAPSACQSKGQLGKMTYDLLFSHFEEFGRIFGVPKAASDLVSKQRHALMQVPKVDSETTALWWSSGYDTPFVGGGSGAPQMVMDAVGITNVAGGIDKTWTSLGWEAIAAKDPDVLILVDASWNTAESKIKKLASNPVTAEMSAVKKKRYVQVPFPAAEAGVRSVPAAVHISESLGELGLIANQSPGARGD